MSANLTALTHALALAQAEVLALQTRKSNIENSDLPYAEALVLQLGEEMTTLTSEITAKEQICQTLTTLKNQYQ